MEGQTVVKEQHRGNLIGNDFCRMIMTRIQETHNAILRGVIHIKFMRAYGVRLNADAENFSFYRVGDVLTVIFDGKDFIKRFFEVLTRSQASAGTSFVPSGIQMSSRAVMPSSSPK